MLNLAPIILLLPAAGFVALGLVGRWLPRWVISVVGCGVVLAAFVLAAVNFSVLQGTSLAARSSDATIWNWVTSGQLSINFGALYDPLSAVMLLVVTGVGFLIHVYSIGYMEGDPGYWRFFSFLNLFVFTMTLLVVADNFLFLLIGWAGVGLSSFLLIGFWYTRPSAVAAAQKAFVVNVIGDFGLMLAIFLIFSRYSTLAYSLVFAAQRGGGPISAVPPYAPNSAEVIAVTLLLFVAAAAKSAQFPLHVWLPDAMEGPTPVSALIHAATMVTAGVYLVARCAPLFDRAPVSLAVVAGIGGFTAFFAATIACVQHDIKRVLAYSTMSQLGYMFMGEGAGGYTAGIFHLTTHAYFKALLFMAAGAVIHALAGEQDMRKMGGLRQRMPWTFWSFVAGGLALAAIFPFSGFWSKDSILSAVWQHALGANASPAWYALYATGLVTAILTGFYIFRLIFAVFLGPYRGGAITAAHGAVAEPAAASDGRAGRAATRDPLGVVHEPGLVMLGPIVILAVLALIGGFVGTPWGDWIGELLAPVTGAPVGLAAGSVTFFVSLALGLAAGLAGIGVAWMRYGARPHTFATVRNPLYAFLANKWYVDALFDRVIVRPIVWIGQRTSRDVEGVLLDGGSKGLAWATGRISAGLRTFQTGYVRNYALGILLGAVVILLYYVVRL
ncbi:MAG TPA: NADH-quinone oxidoreductase subunit L [Ktedonobacterales bacterium]